jgi:hypothetical protein
MLSSRSQKFNLVLHVALSVGWFGAVVVFLALSISGMQANTTLDMISAYSAMETAALVIIVPACIGSLLTGVLQSVGTRWGLIKHYWISTKLLLTVIGTTLLFLHLEPISVLASQVPATALLTEQYDWMRVNLVIEAIAASVLLLFATVISYYKPWGKIAISNLVVNRRRLLLLLILLGVIVLLHTIARH